MASKEIKRGAPREIIFFGSLAFVFGALLVGLGVVSWAFLAIMGFGWSYLGSQRKWPILFTGIFIFLACAGGLYFLFVHRVTTFREHVPIGNTDVSGIVRAEPQVTDTGQRADVILNPPFYGTVRVFLPHAPEVHYGDAVSLQGNIAPPFRGGDLPTISFPRITITATHQGSRVKEALLMVKGGVKDMFARFLPRDPAALLSGLLFGARGDFDASLKDAMARSGTTHLVALSGYNITILAVAIFFVFGKLLPRRATFVITFTVLVLFVLMVGGEASVVRAAVMGALVLVARESGRIYDMSHAIALTAFFMVLFDPTLPVSSIGFVLSFVSLLGVVYVAPVFAHWLHAERDEGMLGWRSVLATTLGAQVAVLPLLLGTFGQVSLVGVVSNLFILLAVPLTMFLGMALALVGALSSVFGAVFGWFVALILGYELGVIRFFSALASPIAIPISPWVFGICYYGILAIIMGRYVERHSA